MIPANITLEEINKWRKNTLMEQLGIEYTEVGSDFLCAKMPVDGRTHQPAGLLHGGASAALAESLGSTASALMIDRNKSGVVGIEINANHLRGMREGWVFGKATALHLGKTTHVWEIKIRDEKDQLVAVCRLTNLILGAERRKD